MYITLRNIMGFLRIVSEHDCKKTPEINETTHAPSLNMQKISEFTSLSMLSQDAHATMIHSIFKRAHFHTCNIKFNILF